jgi:hypothetical protein
MAKHLHGDGNCGNRRRGKIMAVESAKENFNKASQLKQAVVVFGLSLLSVGIFYWGRSLAPVSLTLAMFAGMKFQKLTYDTPAQKAAENPQAKPQL